MLKSLNISNYAIIETLNISFPQGFSVISGETGAGKSILLGALNLMLGQRADSSVMLNANEKCVVEGVFDIENYSLEPFFDDNDLEYEPITIIRREIAPNGKSRAFVNDSPVTLGVLRELTEQLIDIHSQNQNELLEKAHFQLNLVDAFAKNRSLADKYNQQFGFYNKLINDLTLLKEKAAKASADYDYYQFQYNQLVQAEITPGELETLESEQETLSHLEEIKAGMHKISALLDGTEISTISLLNEAYLTANKMTGFYPAAIDMAQRLETALIDLRDLTAEADQKGEDLEANPERLQYVNQRIDLLNSLLQKHRVQHTDELLQIRDKFAAYIDQAAGFDQEIAAIEVLIAQKLSEITNLADQLSETRRIAVQPIQNTITQMAKALGMPNTRFEIRIEKCKLNATGADNISFYFSANKGFEPLELSKVASGGEKSRLMLAFKALLAKSTKLPTILLDEIDTGVSGPLAAGMANIMAQMGEAMQVITITHLPQIAAKGNVHFLVYKNEEANKTTTNIIQLKDNERIDEIARMVSSGHPDEAARNNARSLLGV